MKKTKPKPKKTGIPMPAAVADKIRKAARKRGMVIYKYLEKLVNEAEGYL